MEQGHFWTIVLAAGDGSRVRNLTRDGLGAPIPKQFFCPDGHRSMLRRTLDRATRFGPLERVIVVVAEQHRAWWPFELADLPPENVIVQPQNRGTAAGILLPFLEVVRRDPSARVMVLPSDHYVEREAVLCDSVLEAIDACRADENRIILLGTQPEDADRDYGWIVPSTRFPQTGTSEIDAFVEKPETSLARALARRGALVNTFILAAAARAMLRLYETAAPALLDSFLAVEGCSGDAIDALYEELPRCDFSRDLLEQTPEMLAVLPVPDCGWIDLGTPARLERHRSRGRTSAPSSPEPVSVPVPMPVPIGHYFG